MRVSGWLGTCIAVDGLAGLAPALAAVRPDCEAVGLPTCQAGKEAGGAGGVAILSKRARRSHNAGRVELHPFALSPRHSGSARAALQLHRHTWWGAGLCGKGHGVSHSQTRGPCTPGTNRTLCNFVVLHNDKVLESACHFC